jgi:hypothetical protein
MLGTLSIPRYQALAVGENARVQAISREPAQAGPSETVRRALKNRGEDTVRASRRLEEVDRNIDPPERSGQ